METTNGETITAFLLIFIYLKKKQTKKKIIKTIKSKENYINKNQK